MTMMLVMVLPAMAPTSCQGHSRVIDPKTQTRLSDRPGMTDPLGTDLPGTQAATIKDLGTDLAAGCAKGYRVPLQVTRFVLKIEVGIMIVRLTGVMTIGTIITGTVLVMMCMEVDTSMVSLLASMVDGVMTKGMTVGSDIGPHPVTPETDIHGEIPATQADKTVVALLTAKMISPQEFPP